MTSVSFALDGDPVGDGTDWSVGIYDLSTSSSGSSGSGGSSTVATLRSRASLTVAESSGTSPVQTLALSSPLKLEAGQYVGLTNEKGPPTSRSIPRAWDR